jgi:pantoate--beta-alanine ligase
LHAVDPHVLYLGQKDYQQLAVLRHVISDLDISVAIVAVPTVREKDGLAMSSRNVRLIPEHRASASVIFSGLSACKSLFDGGERKISELRDSVLRRLQTVPSCSIEYVSVVDATSLAPISEADDSVVVCVAVQFGDVRLIDNIVLEVVSH